jgi:outer membrane protein assembly factor BamB
VNSNSVFAISGTSLYRLNRQDGSRVWSLRLPQVPSAPPAADEDRVVVSTVDGRLYVYNIETREVIWFYQTNAQVSMPAVLYDERIACASQDGLLYVFGVASREPRHRYKTNAPVSAPIATWSRLVLVASEDNNVYAVNIRTGDTPWHYTFGTEIRRAISVIDNQVFVTPEAEGLHVLDAENGTEIWSYSRAERFVAASAGRVYASDRFGRLVILERATGRMLGLWDTHNLDFRLLNESNDRLYLATRSGLVICCHEKENKEPLVHKRVLPPAPPGAKTEGAQGEPAKPGTKPGGS